MMERQPLQPQPGRTYAILHRRKGAIIARFIAVEPGDEADQELWRFAIEGGGERLLRPSLIERIEERGTADGSR